MIGNTILQRENVHIFFPPTGFLLHLLLWQLFFEGSRRIDHNPRHSQSVLVLYLQWRVSCLCTVIYFDDGTYLFGLEEITVVNIRTPTPRRKPSSRHTNVVIG
jgi:hypothetical protein